MFLMCEWISSIRRPSGGGASSKAESLRGVSWRIGGGVRAPLETEDFLVCKRVRSLLGGVARCGEVGVGPRGGEVCSLGGEGCDEVDDFFYREGGKGKWCIYLILRKVSGLQVIDLTTMLWPLITG